MSRPDTYLIKERPVEFVKDETWVFTKREYWTLIMGLRDVVNTDLYWCRSKTRPTHDPRTQLVPLHKPPFRFSWHPVENYPIALIAPDGTDFMLATSDGENTWLQIGEAERKILLDALNAPPPPALANHVPPEGQPTASETPRTDAAELIIRSRVAQAVGLTESRNWSIAVEEACEHARTLERETVSLQARLEAAVPSPDIAKVREAVGRALNSFSYSPLANALRTEHVLTAIAPHLAKPITEQK